MSNKQKMREIMAEEFYRVGWKAMGRAIVDDKCEDTSVSAILKAIDRIAKLPQPESQAMGRAELQPPIESTGISSCPK